MGLLDNHMKHLDVFHNFGCGSSLLPDLTPTQLGFNWALQITIHIQ